MKYDTLKTAVASYVYNKDNTIKWEDVAMKLNLHSLINEGKRTRVVELVKQIKDKVWDAIMLVDIRCIQTLVEIAPAAVPVWIRNGNYYLELTDNGWEILKPEAD